jgi:hypothetical protein
MKKMYLSGLFALIFLFAPGRLSAGSGYAITNGNWNSENTWIIDGAHAKPGCGDTLMIGVDEKVVVSAQANYSYCNEPMHIIIGGELQFTNGFKLELPDAQRYSFCRGRDQKNYPRRRQLNPDQYMASQFGLPATATCSVPRYLVALPCRLPWSLSRLKRTRVR